MRGITGGLCASKYFIAQQMVFISFDLVLIFIHFDLFIRISISMMTETLSDSWSQCLKNQHLIQLNVFQDAILKCQSLQNNDFILLKTKKIETELFIVVSMSRQNAFKTVCFHKHN